MVRFKRWMRGAVAGGIGIALVSAVALRVAAQNTDDPVHYTLKMRLRLNTVDARHRISSTVLLTPVVMDSDGSPAQVKIESTEGGYEIGITPHRSRGNTVLLSAEVKKVGADKQVICSGKNERRVPLGKTSRITGMTESADAAILKAVQTGNLPGHHGDYTGYILEVTPTVTGR